MINSACRQLIIITLPKQRPHSNTDSSLSSLIPRFVPASHTLKRQTFMPGSHTPADHLKRQTLALLRTKYTLDRRIHNLCYDYHCSHAIHLSGHVIHQSGHVM